jgi:hypothetical protein
MRTKVLLAAALGSISALGEIRGEELNRQMRDGRSRSR